MPGGQVVSSQPMPTPSPLIYFENAAGRLAEHPDGYAIFQYHPGLRKLSDLQALLTHTAALLRRRGWHKLLGDQRRMSPFTAQERALILDSWLTGSTMPKGVYAAVILAEDVFARLAASQVITETQEAAITYRLFDTEAAAAAWLRQLP
jgi:hypothetical protein